MKITITEKQIKMDPPLNIGEATNLLLNALLSMLNSAIKNDEKLRQPLYDMFNGAASEMLQHIIPDSDLHPNITEEAIMQLENELLDKHEEEKKAKAKPAPKKEK